MSQTENSKLKFVDDQNKFLKVIIIALCIILLKIFLMDNSDKAILNYIISLLKQIEISYSALDYSYIFTYHLFAC